MMTPAPIGWPTDAIPTIADRWARVAAMVPDRAAVTDGETVLSYAALDTRSASLAAAIAADGRHGEPVAVITDHGALNIVVLLAAIRAGRPYTVIDPATPARRIAQIADDLTTTTFIAAPDYHDIASALVGEGRVIDPSVAPAAAPSAGAVPPANHPIAGIFYTSGSTGEPKGVMRSQAAIVDRVRYEAAAVGLGPGDTTSHLYSCSYGSSQNDLWCGLLTGATVACHDVATLGITRMAAWLLAQRVSWLHIPISLLRQFLGTLGSGERFPDLRVVLPASGRMFGSDVATIRAHVPNEALVYSQFASTETSLTSRLVLRSGDTFAPDEIIPTGYCIPGRSIDVVDESGAPVGIDDEGTIMVHGHTLSPGYWNRPEQTAQVFTDHPDPDKGRSYNTGDVGRIDATGQLHFVGRRDNRIKVRGYRVQLDAVAAHVRALDEIAEAAVVLDPSGRERLVAYVVMAAGRTLDPAGLRSTLSADLPVHQLPALFVALPELPLTANGKIDGNRLTRLEAAPAPDSVAYTGPRTATETTIAEIWQEALGIERVGVDDRFAELGGDSLTAMRIVARVVAACGVEVGLRDLLDRGTVALMAAVVDGAEAAARPIPPAGPGPHPLSHQQQAIWLAEMINPDERFRAPKIIELAGPLDIVWLRRALQRVVGRHAVLTTSTALTGAEPTQSVSSEAPVELPVIASETDDEHARTIRSVSGAHQAEIRLDRGVPYRATLVARDPQRHTLVLTVHHVVSDRASTSILLEELAAAYRIEGGATERLPDLPVSYLDYAAHQRTTFADDELEVALDHWRDALTPDPPVIRPLVRDTRHLDPPDPTSFDVSIGPTATQRLRELARAENTTLFVVVLATLKAAITVVTGQTDVVVTTLLSGRERRELEALIGCFVTSVPIRTTVDPATPMPARIRAERAATMAALAHRDVPFEAIVGALNPPRHQGRAPYFDVTLNFSEELPTTFDFGPVVARRVDDGGRRADGFDVRMTPAADGIRGSVSIDTAWIDAETADAVVKAMLSIIDDAVAAADPPE